MLSSNFLENVKRIQIEPVLEMGLQTTSYLHEEQCIMKIRGVGKIHKILHNLRATEIAFQRRVWQRWHNPTRHTTPVFLMGCGRSGTTMLLFHLGRYWQVEPYNENNPAVFEKWRLRDLAVIKELIAQSYAPIVLIKPILNTYQTRVLLSMFPDAKVLFVFRHYDDVINSFRKKFGTRQLENVADWINNDFAEFSATPPPSETKHAITSRWKPSLSPESGVALYWLFQNRLYFDLQLDRDERVYLVQYKTLVSKPEQEFKEICNFLELPFEPRIIDGIFATSIKRDAPPQIEPDIRAACEEIWQRLCSRKQIGVTYPAPV